MDPSFFLMRDNSIYTRGFSYASGLYAPHIEKQCPRCERRMFPLFQGEAEALIEKGSQWSDIVGAGSARPPFMISQRVIDTLHEANVTGFEQHSVRITDIKSAKLRIISPPQYYYLNIDGHMDIDLEASEVKVALLCPVCFASEKRSQPERFVPLAETWDGSDVFILRNFPSGLIFCTRKVLELARQHSWTNFRFQPMNVLQHDAMSWKGIDYLGKKWPPQWYPDPKGKEASQ